jgi:glycopeptide antibiotics resistance protein
VPSITGLYGEVGRVGFFVLVAAVLTACLLFVALCRRRGNLRLAALVAGSSLTVVLLGVLSLTLFGWERGAMPRLILDPIEGAWGWDSIAWRPVIDNIALFVPVGALATAVWWRRSPVLVWLGSVALSVGIEAFQYLVPTGRVANAADVVANATGALLGVLLALLLGVRRGPRAPRRARRDDRVAVGSHRR